MKGAGDEVLRESAAQGCDAIWVLEDHSPVGGLGDRLREVFVTGDLLNSRAFTVLGVEGYPACGTPSEALQAHGLSGAQLAQRIGATEKATA